MKHPSLESMDAHWTLFAKLHFPGLSADELAAARTVFYAGGVSVFAYITDRVAALGEDEGQRAIGALRREFTEFARAELERERHPDPDARH